MTSPSTAGNSFGISTLDAYDYCAAVASTFVIYDYLLTLGRESKLWRRRSTRASAVYYANRYTSLLWAIFNVTAIFPLSRVVTCSAVMIVDIILLLLLSVISAAFSALRVFASSGRDWPLTSLTGFLALMQFITNLAIYSKTTYSVAHLPYFGAVCNQSFDMSYSIITKVTIVGCCCTIGSDAIVLATIIYHTRHIRGISHTSHFGTSIAMVMRRDGLLYFGTLLVLNVLDLALFVPKIYLNVGMNFVIPISSVVISHYLLDLRETRIDETLTSTPEYTRHWSSATTESDCEQPEWAGWQDKTSSNQAVEAIELTLL